MVNPSKAVGAKAIKLNKLNINRNKTALPHKAQANANLKARMQALL